MEDNLCKKILNKLTDINESKLTLTQIPPEILEIICGYLCPKDLFSLTLVCKKLKNFLWSFDSNMTQRIWRNSRIRWSTFVEYKGVPPPSEEIMSQQKCIWLIDLVDACQICGDKRKDGSRIYWPFKLYSCKNCIDSRVISFESAIQKGISGSVFYSLPCIFLYNEHGVDRYCLESDVLKTQREYESINVEKREEWIKEKIGDQFKVNDLLIQYTQREESRIRKEKPKCRPGRATRMISNNYYY
ncbi:hypothetical protein RhiirA5_393341 [Rhizophagus irregularis]|uniref:F-box domain-containing protein n=3 Tax=Rhizophagus irregularis TaxID=588596 RepID=U9USE6_RHIID|nr:hypothetical protein GLOIN_2v1766995 [Rhizophagus irregularis DAOM 181602=DAOM 197198]EXX75087.1 hypothetical protein RirG_044920 [Rhizophagus irregularis DAOM 197198w]PKC17864.1 hypothetical protein RhiirA5_393341 [Rhizophagus irregularis]PKC70708.1 hypothetical protein RhiirA1_439302 [Rhizophagus irregularis]PKK73362.1 hypothetical protein RhiirC2_847702 [Rhizophagus irregularis]PKY16970.1 hypothetical protein RhiirB3_521618 [Rhizophagus irregularis]|eukprot:XP_025185106.1 hypothetical protein GLOIN_2v1766995 [Rhizophagus irregularis DAOM 181602=DAOM 197198]